MPLEHLPLDRAVRVLERLVPAAHPTAAPDGAALLLAGDAASRAQARSWLRWLDVPHASELRVYVRPVSSRDADELAERLREASEGWQPAVRIVSDARTAQLIVVCTRQAYAKLDRLAARLDRPASAGPDAERQIRVLRPADAAPASLRGP